MSGMLADRLRQRIHREGPIPFDRFMAAALYDETGGFFVRGGGAGRAGRDFVTSPETGSLFGALIARFLDQWWKRMERPDPFVVVDAGAGSGRLAADVLRATPACAPALRYVLVERSARLREEQRERLPIEPADRALGPAAPGDTGDAPVPVTGIGPIVTALDELPATVAHGVVIANELLDNLPVRIVEWTGENWDEIRVGERDGEFVEIAVPAPPEVATAAKEVRAGAAVAAGTRLPVPMVCAEWIESVSAALHRGALVVVDYAADAASLVDRGQDGWLRTYRAHQRGGKPLADPGEQDVTCDVPIEHLLGVAARAGFTLEEQAYQRDWLHALGLNELADAAAASWRAGAARGDLETLAARSRVSEADALTDPEGLGAHRVVVFSKDIRPSR
jgi:NADH dehydrogenase [ubiquinone] 1 alpha subcomplex assembly factor 7